MRNLLLEYTINLPTEAQENSCFKPVNEAGAKLFLFAEKLLPTEVKHTAAYLAFERSWVEFVNNSHDASAKRLTVRFLQHTDSIEIEIMDNGRGLPAEKETTRYDWKKAILAISDKADGAKASGKKSCGQHLALSTTAYALERQNGHLAITNRENANGALVKIVSPLTACHSDEFLEPKPGKGRNLIDEMFLVAIEKDEDAIHQIRNISSSPDFTGSRKKAAQAVLTKMATPSDEAISTPILATPLISLQLGSPAFMLERLQRNSGNSFPSANRTPFNTPISTTGGAALPAVSFFSTTQDPKAPKNVSPLLLSQ